jgi:ABC-2 type transport system ATP-binding protein
LYKYYGDYRAIGPISVTIERGQVVGLLGLNGAGKTTTLRILACDLLPTSGQVRIDGIDVISEPERIRARVGYLPDTPPLYGEMTVREYLRFAAKLRGVSNKVVGKRVEEVLGLTELSAVADTMIQTLSHGFRQRVGIAQAIVHQPAVVVLDEPISGLDPVQIVEMRQLIRNLKQEHAVVISSHILSEISETCDRILVIRDGQIAASGTEAELSAQLHGGMTIDVTVNRPAELEPTAVIDFIASSPHIERVEKLLPREVGERILSLRVTMSTDERHSLVSNLVDRGCSLLELARSERELENVFLQLSEARGASSAAATDKKTEESS